VSAPTVGTALPPRDFHVTRLDLVRYCGASGDFNPLHWSDRVAREAGLPGVIAHGMLTLAIAARALTDWCGTPALRSYGARFSRPFAIPDSDDGVVLHVEGSVTGETPNGLLEVALTVTSDGVELLSRAEATIAWPQV
jgi:acyl dehydratase